MLIYDIEIIKGISSNGYELPGIEYCKGWHDHDGMGVSCICAYDYETSRYRTFLKDNFTDFYNLAQQHGIIVGFNNIAFDNEVVKVAGIIDIPKERSYDILVEIWKGAGLGERFEYPSRIGFGLDACCRANFGTKKTGDGAMAPVEYQQGKIGTVIDYCLNDVFLTKQLLDRIIEIGGIIDPRDTAKFLWVKRPK